MSDFSGSGLNGSSLNRSDLSRSNLDRGNLGRDDGGNLGRLVLSGLVLLESFEFCLVGLDARELVGLSNSLSSESLRGDQSLNLRSLVV